jgi:hypothetical protein
MRRVIHGVLVPSLRKWLACGAAAILATAFVSCGHYQNTHFRVVEEASDQPLAAAKFSTQFVDGYSLSLGDLFRPQWTHTQPQSSMTDQDGRAMLRVPLGRTTGLSVISSKGKPIDPQDFAGTAVTIKKSGFADKCVWNSNREWRRIGSASSWAAPYLIRLRQDR